MALRSTGLKPFAILSTSPTPTSNIFTNSGREGAFERLFHNHALDQLPHGLTHDGFSGAVRGIGNQSFGRL